MTPNQQREELSKAYVTAVVAQCGFKLGHWSQDDDCLDVTVGAAGPVGLGTLKSPKIDIQLKSTTDQSHDLGTQISWSLKRAHYDILRDPMVCTPKVLVILMLPERIETSVEHTADQLVLRRCAYWVSLVGEPAIDDGTKKYHTVYLPKSNVFSPDALRKLLEKISAEEAL